MVVIFICCRKPGQIVVVENKIRLYLETYATAFSPNIMFNYGRLCLACSGLWHLVITDCSLVWSVARSRFTVHGSIAFDVVSYICIYHVLNKLAYIMVWQVVVTHLNKYLYMDAPL